MRNTTLSNKINVTLFAGALALAAMAPTHAQVLGGGSLAGGLGGGLNGTMQSTMGQI
ncbi:MAG: hypothetical protein HOQ10_12615, partial [Frateuria sp.]|nr:hypothetical protein [Frateuria sp.]